MKRKEFETKLFLTRGREFELLSNEDNINIWRVHKFIYYPNIVLQSNKRELNAVPYLLLDSDWSYRDVQKKLNKSIVNSIIKNLGEQRYERIKYRFYDNIFVTDSTVIVYVNDKCTFNGKKNKFYRLMMKTLKRDYPKDKYIYLLIDNEDYQLKLKLI